MGIGDKAKHLAEELAGKAKAAAGDATDDPGLEARGHAEAAGANVKQAGDDVVDALRDARNSRARPRRRRATRPTTPAWRRADMLRPQGRT